jgi:thiol-disulfide isomerase/thioredoxin
MRKIFTILSLSIFIFFGSLSISEATNKVDAYLFYGNGCPHCAKEIKFFNSIKDKYPDLNVTGYEVYYSQENSLLMQKVANYLGAEGGGVPFLIIGDKYFVGFGEESSPVEIESRINECLVGQCSNNVGGILGFKNEEVNPMIQEESINTEISNEDVIPYKEINTELKENEKIIKLPFLGNTNIHKLSLPVLAILMGLLDGFNPCAMWTLLFLISLLLGMNNRKRMWTLGVAFIVASASVYFIFMSAWLNLVLFLGLIIWVRLAIALLALFGGSYSIREFFTSTTNGCKVTGSEKRQKVFEKLKNIVKQNNLWIALGGIILLAFLVNLVELICSAGLPAVFTQVLAMNNLSTWGYYSHILLYIFFFMIDDLFVFFIAMITLKMTGITTKYAKYSHLIGGILMVIIGVLLVFKPEWLMFG